MTKLEDHGFIRVHCEKCTNADVWLKCENCAKSTNFLLDDKGVSCHCEATYSHAVCLCGERVDREGLTFVPFDKGPLSLTDFQVSWPRVAILMTAVAGIGAGIWFFALA